VRCTVTGAPCIKFGASGITLNLNGHTMTGNGSVNSCAPKLGEDAIDTAGQNHVSTLGPGIVRQFQGEATIVVSGNTSYVQHVVVLSSCNDGIAVRGSNNNITVNTVDLSNLSRLRGVGIVIVSGGANLIQKNEVAGATDAISVVGSNNNFIKENNASGVYSQSRGIVIE
jgi:parallel beta-helix repeat protein